MPPKKKTKPTPTIKSDFLASLPQNLTSTSSPAILTSEHLLRAYGLASPRPNAAEDEIINRVCPNKWLEKPVVVPEVVVVEPAKEEEIVITDSENEDEEVIIVDTTKKAKGKGKAVAVIKASCNLGHCSDNPKCLNWLGQDKWENSEKAFEALKSNMGMGGDPSNPREPDTPVGLRNLGATCYANSFLQVWFQDETFRAGVYACQPPSNGKIENSPLYQLQVLFAFLQTSKQAVYNPEPLVSSLKLDKGEQQDSQEFSKLFMSLLDHEFKKQGGKDAEEGVNEGGVQVATLVEDQFEGKITYGIECNRCHNRSERHSTFLELEVVLKKDCKLEEQLRESLRSEAMTGDNKYFCENCDTKRDATRSTVLQHLPPVLHISLLRFVFSSKDFTRSKSTHSMFYPLKLNMGEFLPQVDGKSPEVWYDLRGVLMHKGTSAHHGHYVAQVRDGSTDKWYLFDDETVTPIADLNAPGKYDDEDEPVVAKKPSKMMKEGFVRQSNGEILPKSKDAYMLIYAKREPERPTGQAKPDQPIPSPLAAANVEDLDLAHDISAGVYLDQEMAAKAEFKKLLDQKRSVYRVWDMLQDDEDTYLVDKAELKKWMESDLPVIKPKSKKTTTYVKPPEILVDDDVLIVNTVVGVEGEAESKPEVKDQDIEMDNGTIVEGSISPTLIGDELVEEVKSAEKKSEGVEDHSAEKVDAEVSSEEEEVVEISKSLSNLEVLCSHQKANPAKAKDMKRISQLGVMALQELGFSIEPTIIPTKDLCRECVWGIASQNLYRQTHSDQVETFNEQNLSEEGAIWISKTWLNDWLKDSPSMHKPDRFEDPAPDSEAFQGHVHCLHKKLQPVNKLRKLISLEGALFLESIFPSWDYKAASIQESPPCGRCDEKLSQDLAQLEIGKKKLSKEKLALKSFDNQSRLIGTKAVVVANLTSYVIPRRFVQDWVKYSKGKTTVPDDLDNSHFLCKHRRLIVDIKQEMDAPSEIEVIPEKEWKLLVSNYNAGPAISVFLAGSNIETDPEVCLGCLEEKRHDFSITEIKIKTLTGTDFKKDGTRKIQTQSEPVSPVVSKVQRTYGSDVRSSRRLAEKPAMLAAKVMFPIEIEKSDTVKDLKIKIYERKSIPTIYQRLFLDGRELDNDETIEALGICGGSTVELFEVKDLIDIDDLDDAVPDVKSKKSGAGEGFGGTGLFGWENGGDQMVIEDDDDIEILTKASSSSSHTNSSSSKKKKRRASSPLRETRENSFPTMLNCGVCTFEQVFAEKCVMCGVEL